MRRLFKPKLTKLTVNESCDLDDFPLYEDIDDTSRDVLGITSDGAIVCADRDIFNKLVVGASGSGKTQSAVKTGLWQSLKNGESVIVSDTNGNLYKETSKVFEENGYTVKVLNFKPEERQYSDGFNPIALIQPGNPDNEMIADTISDIILKGFSDTAGYRGPLWEAQTNLLKSLILYVGTDSRLIEDERNNIPSIYDFLISANISDYEKLICKGREPSDPAIRSLKKFLLCTDDVKKQIINAATILLQPGAIGWIRQILSHNEIDIYLPKKKKCIYYVISGCADYSCSSMMSVFFTLSLLIQGQIDTPSSQTVHYIMDEYLNTGRLDLDKVSTAYMRAQKAKGTFVFSCISDVESSCGDHLDDFLRSCDYKVLLGASDARTTRYFRGLTDYIDPGKNYDTDNLKKDEVLIAKSDMFMVLKKYFSETLNEPVHPLEKRAQALRYIKVQSHTPEWRKEIDQ